MERKLLFDINPSQLPVPILKIYMERIRVCVGRLDILVNIPDFGRSLNELRSRIRQELEFRDELKETTSKVSNLGVGMTYEQVVAEFNRLSRQQELAQSGLSYVPLHENPFHVIYQSMGEVKSEQSFPSTSFGQAQMIDVPMESSFEAPQPTNVGEEQPQQSSGLEQIQGQASCFVQQPHANIGQPRQSLTYMLSSEPGRSVSSMELDSSSDSDSEERRRRNKKAVKRLGRRPCSVVAIRRPRRRNEDTSSEFAKNLRHQRDLEHRERERKKSLMRRRMIKEKGDSFQFPDYEIIEILRKARGQQLNDYIYEYVMTGTIKGEMPAPNVDDDEPQPGPSASGSLKRPYEEIESSSDDSYSYLE